jgi:hypothetical protein
MRVCTVLLVCLAALSAGCRREPPRYAVSGTVKIDGVPAAYATVRFLVDGPGGGLTRADEAGQFAIGEDGANTGLTAGTYKVTFSQTLIDGKPALGGGGGKASETLPSERENVPEKYRDEATTPETATVGPTSRAFDFDIKR